MKIAYKLTKPEELVKSAKEKTKNKQELTYDECIALFAHYCKKAISFYGIDPAWNITLYTNGTEEGASVSFNSRYLHAEIYMNPEYFRHNPTDIGTASVHEIAHIFLGKIHGFLQILPQEFSDENHPFNKFYEDAYEEAATRMERLFFKYMED